MKQELIAFHELRCRDCIVVGCTTTYAISATKVASSNPAHAEVCSIQHYATGRWFFPGTTVSFTETGHHDIAEMWLKLELNTITLTFSGTPSSPPGVFDEVSVSHL